MGGVVKAVTKIAEVASPVASVFGGPVGTFASLAMTGFSAMQQRRQGKKAAKYQEQQVQIQQRAEKQKERYAQLQAQRARIAERRKARIRQGEILAQTGASFGSGIGGVSGSVGALGSVGTQAASNIGDINVAQGFASQQSGFNIAAAQAGSQSQQALASAQGWQQIGQLGQTFGGSFGNIFGSANTDPTKK